jgi:DNA-binding NtrC family response regulator
VPVVVITAHGTISNAVEAMKKGAFDYITKPFDPDEIELVVERAMEHARLVEENASLKRELGRPASSRRMVGSSGGLSETWGTILRAAESDATVLIRGETGTGKELAAEAVHANSRRARGPFIRVNCAALAGGLLESELFGHEKGAFTGADSRRIGRFELAAGGSILLDEISEMSLDLQGKLLRVLQEKAFERVGSSKTLFADVRIIATSNRDLESEMGRGTFRRDVFYRLNVVPIVMPPLRDRRGDIPDLARHFAESSASRQGVKPPAISGSAMEKLRRYDWPGNVRELENVIERALVLYRPAEIAPEHLVLPGPLPGNLSARGEGKPKLEDLEKEHILSQLKKHGGHRKNTAEALGISERTLRNKLAAYRAEGAIE